MNTMLVEAIVKSNSLPVKYDSLRVASAAHRLFSRTGKGVMILQIDDKVFTLTKTADKVSH